jgi:hypothetical protein
MKFVLRYKDKKKTFNSEIEINHFIGAYDNDALRNQVNETTYYKICERRGTKMIWDDGTEMTGREWAMCTRTIYQELG